MREFFGFVWVVTTIICIIVVINLFVGMFFLKDVSEEIGPNQVVAWETDQGQLYSGQGVVEIKKTGHNFTVTTEDGAFVITGTPDEQIAVGEEELMFRASLPMVEGEKYRLDSDAEIYSLEPMTVKHSYYPVGDNLMSILLLIILWAIITLLSILLS